MKKNKLVKVLIIILCILAALVIGATIWLGSMVSEGVLYQNAGNDTHDNSIKQLETWGYDLEAFTNAHSGVEISAEAEDGNMAIGTLFNENNDACVILVHGAGGDRYSVYPLAQGYLENGIDVIAIDQRGSGINPDDKVTFGIHESLDVAAFVAYAKNDLGYSKVIVHGQSMGGQTVAIYASNVTPGSIYAADAVVLDSPVPGMELMLLEMFSDGNTEDAFSNYLVVAGKMYMKVFDGIDWDDADTIDVVKNDQLPTLLIVSEKDEICLPEQEEELYDNIASEDKKIMYVDSAHIEGMIDDPEGYMEGVMGFLEEENIER